MVTNKRKRGSRITRHARPRPRSERVAAPPVEGPFLKMVTARNTSRTRFFPFGVQAINTQIICTLSLALPLLSEMSCIPSWQPACTHQHAATGLAPSYIRKNISPRLRTRLNRPRRVLYAHKPTSVYVRMLLALKYAPRGQITADFGWPPRGLIHRSLPSPFVPSSRWLRWPDRFPDFPFLLRPLLVAV